MKLGPKFDCNLQPCKLWLTVSEKYLKTAGVIPNNIKVSIAIDGKNSLSACQME